MQDELSRVCSEENLRTNHMKGRDGTTAFLPLSPKIGGLINNDKPSIGQYLTREQVNFVYKKTESGEMIITETLQQETRTQKAIKIR